MKAIRERLRLRPEAESYNEWLKREAAIGFAQLSAGQMIRVKTKEEFLLLAKSRSGEQ